jgi:hypothetical protein
MGMRFKLSDRYRKENPGGCLAQRYVVVWLGSSAQVKGSRVQVGDWKVGQIKNPGVMTVMYPHQMYLW